MQASSQELQMQDSLATHCSMSSLPVPPRRSRRVSYSEETFTSPSPAGTPALPTSASDGLRVIVKNTFLDVDDRTPSSCFSAAHLDAHGARSCMARLSSEADIDDDGTSPRPRMVKFFSDESPYTSKDESCTSPSSSRSTGESEEARQIIIQLVPETLQVPENVGVEVSNTFIEDGTGNICIDLKVVLGEAHPSENLFSLGQIIPVSIASECQAQCVSRPSMSSFSSASSGAFTPGLSGEIVTADEFGSCAPKMRSAMVCRHWKHGWCRYEDNCRFMHPSEKKGASGSPESEIGLPSRRQRSSQQIGRRTRRSTNAGRIRSAGSSKGQGNLVRNVHDSDAGLPRLKDGA